MGANDTPQSDLDKQLLSQAIPIEDSQDLLDASSLEPAQEKAPSSAGAQMPPAAIELDSQPDDLGMQSNKAIRSFDHHKTFQEDWKRPCNTTGTGATHVRTFICKLRLDAVGHLDEQINAWLEKHPEYEVKFVSSSIGILTGKLKEEAVFMSVWV